MPGTIALPSMRQIIAIAIVAFIGITAFAITMVMTRHGAPVPAPVHADLKSYLHNG